MTGGTGTMTGGTGTMTGGTMTGSMNTFPFGESHIFISSLVSCFLCFKRL